MRRIILVTVSIAVCLVACGRKDADEVTPLAEPTSSATSEPAVEPTAGEAVPAPPAAEPTEAAGTTEAPTDAAPFQGIRNGFFESERFNVRFQWPATWSITSGPTADSLTVVGPDGLQMIIANSRSFQLVDTNFEQLNDRVSFDNVNILPDRTETRPINGLPGYRVEGDALLRGENVPIYFVSQAIALPGEPIVVTIFIPGENYYLHSEEMKAVLDSIEALNLRPE